MYNDQDPTYLHPLSMDAGELPQAFTFPFRYTPHPLCRRAAAIVQAKLAEMDVREGKMFGVLIVEGAFMAAYSGQLSGSYAHPWFVPPVVDYLHPESHFQCEQAGIVALSGRIEALQQSQQHAQMQARVYDLRCEREAAIATARQAYAQGKAQRDAARRQTAGADTAELIRQSQQQKADIQRAKQLHREEIASLEAQLAEHNAAIRQLSAERKRRSEELQQWLFSQFTFLNAEGTGKDLTELFGSRHFIPSGAGECCAPKLLQAAYTLGLKPLAMAEFWWGPSAPGHYREPGAFFPACRSKCYPILGHMLQGLTVEPDPALHYDTRRLAPIRVVWEDSSMAVVVKPEGWVSIPGRSDQPCLLDECFRLWPDISGPVVVHRLDMDTSGLMLIAKNAQVHRALSQQFERREVHKRYIALIETGHLARPREFTLDIPLAPDLDNLPRQRVDTTHGKEAITRCTILGEEMHNGVRVTRVAFYPATGRTHQLRVHAAAPEGLAYPILGDRLYGHVADRMYLHADTIEFTHPITHERLRFTDKAPF